MYAPPHELCRSVYWVSVFRVKCCVLPPSSHLAQEHLTYLRRESRNLVGEEVDLASPQKLSDLLFNTLRMRPPIER